MEVPLAAVNHLNSVKQRALNGDAAAQYECGILFMKQYKAEKSLEEKKVLLDYAQGFLRNAALSGHRTAGYALWIVLKEKAQFIPAANKKDEALLQAHTVLIFAARAGHEQAQMDLATEKYLLSMQLTDLKEREDVLDQTIVWYKKAEAQGNTKATHLLSRIYSEKRDAETDPVKKEEFGKLSAKLNDKIFQQAESLLEDSQMDTLTRSLLEVFISLNKQGVKSTIIPNSESLNSECKAEIVENSLRNFVAHGYDPLSEKNKEGK